MGRLNERFAVARETRRHIVHDEPEDVRAVRGDHAVGDGREEKEMEEAFHEAMLLSQWKRRQELFGEIKTKSKSKNLSART